MRVPRASANQMLCSTEDSCSCFDDGTIRVDVSAGHVMGHPGVFHAQHIYVFGLCEGQILWVDREWRDDCDPMWGPWMNCGKPVQLTQCSPETILTVPGRYRIIMAQEDGCPELDPEHVRVQVTEIPSASASLRLQEKQLCCCGDHNHA